MARKNIRLQYNAPVTLTFFFLSLASLVLGYLTNNWTTTHLFSVYCSSMTDPLFYVRLFGHVLGHGGWDHFINNMLLFLVVAPPLEERYGSRTLLSGILMTALVSGILQCVLFPSSALLGASGIVFMLIMLSSLAGSKNGGIPITFILVGVLYLSQQVYSILFIQDNVANFMHIKLHLPCSLLRPALHGPRPLPSYPLSAGNSRNLDLSHQLPHQIIPHNTYIYESLT